MDDLKSYFCLVTVTVFLIYSCTMNENSTYQVIDSEMIENLVELPDNLKEVSGFAAAGNGFLWAHNDSGNSPVLYLISFSSKDVVRTVKIQNADNKDWEELTADEAYIYIGDFGNNAGARKDLKIYIVSKAELDSADTVQAQIIAFNYPEQTDFGYDGHNFDCEAMISVGDSLYLFTKNRGDGHTDLYALPKKPGRYAARHLDRYDTRGLVTGADLLPEAKLLIIMGYNYTQLGKFKPFIWLFEDVEEINFFSHSGRRFDFPFYKQTEALCFESPEVILFTEEEENNEKASLMRLDLSNLLSK